MGLDYMALPLAFQADGENCRSLGFPGFPVELGGVGELHAPFLTERRTRGSVQCCAAGNPGSLPMNKTVSPLAFDTGKRKLQIPRLRSG